MYDGSILQDVYHDIVDTKTEAEQTKHAEIRKYGMMVLGFLLLIYLIKGKKS